MKFEFEVTSVGPDSFAEKVKRADGSEAEVSIPCVAVELVSADEGVGTVSLWVSSASLVRAVKAASLPDEEVFAEIKDAAQNLLADSGLVPGALWIGDFTPKGGAE